MKRMVKVVHRTLAAFVTAVLTTSSVSACPLCESETGKRVRSGIFDSSFGYHLLVTLLPFLVLIAVVGLIHFGPPRTRTSPQAHTTSGREGAVTPDGRSAKEER